MNLCARPQWKLITTLLWLLLCPATDIWAQSRIDTEAIPRIASNWIADAEMNDDVVVLKGHTSGVHTVAYCENGEKLVTGSADGTARIWDAISGRELIKIEKTGYNGCYAAVSSDGSRILTTNIPYVKLWDAKTGRPLLDLTGRVGLESHWPFPFQAAMSHDGTQFITAARPTRRAVGTNDFNMKLRDSKTGDELVTLKGQDYWPNCAAFSPDGSRVITGCQTVDDSAKVWDCKTGGELLSLKGHGGSVWSVAFARDGQTVATSGVDRIVRIWDLKTRKERYALAGHERVVTAISFSPQDEWILTAGADRTARAWDAKTGTALFILPCHSEMLTSAEISPDGRHFATASWDKTARIWNLESLCKHAGCELPD
jgi:WD40 repeat protein